MSRKDHAMTVRHATRVASVAKRRAMTIVATLLAVALAFGVLTPKSSYAAELNDVPESIAVDAQSRVPVVESTIGRGDKLDSEGTVIQVPGVDGYDSALVRVSVFDADQDATVNVAGTPALAVQAGHDASQTVLAPIVDDGIAVSSSAAVDARIEVLALFAGGEDVPGATNAVDEPVVRADTAQGIAGTTLGAEEMTVDLTGQGGVPSTDVRAVYVTMTVDETQAGNMTVAGQQIAVPAGYSVVSTIVVPDPETQSIEVSADKELGAFTLAVRGWVRGSVQNDAKANIKGSFVPTVDAVKQDVSTSPENAESEVAMQGISDRALSIVLLDATAQNTAESAGTRHTFVDVGVMSDRSQGVVVDDENGALAQIAVANQASQAVAFSSRGAGVTASVLDLGAIVGDRPTESGSVEVTITSPSEGDSIDLAETGGEVTLEGIVSSDAAIEKVEVYVAEDCIGTADIVYDNGNVLWSMETGVPDSDTYTFDVKATSRDGAVAKNSVTLNIEQMGDDDDVIANDVAVLNVDDDQSGDVEGADAETGSYATYAATTLSDDDASSAGTVYNAEDGDSVSSESVVLYAGKIRTVNDDSIVFDEEPRYKKDGNLYPLKKGLIISSGVVNGVENGLLRKIESITEMCDIDTGETLYVVTTTDAKLTEVIVQNPLNHNFVERSEVYEESPTSTDTVWEENDGFEPIESDAMDVEWSTEGKALGVACGFILSKSKNQVGCYKPGEESKAVSEAKEIAKNSNTTGGVSAFASASVSINLNVDFEIDSYRVFGPLQTFVKRFEVSFTGNASEGLDLEAWGQYKDEVTIPLYEMANKPHVYMVAWVPVVITPTMSIDLVGYVDAAIDVSYKPEWTQTFTYGWVYEHGDWSVLKEKDQEEKTATCGEDSVFTAKGTLDTRVGISFKPGVKLYETLGGEATITGQVGTDVGITNQDDEYDGFVLSVAPKFIIYAGVTVYVKAPWAKEFLTDKTFDLIDNLVFQGKKFTIVLSQESESCTVDSDDSDGSGSGVQEKVYTGLIYDRYHYAVNAGEEIGIEGAVIKFESGNSETTVTTNSDGRYSVTLPQKDYSITIAKDGYVTVTKSSDEDIRTIGLWPEVGDLSEYTIDVDFTGDIEGLLYVSGYYHVEDAWSTSLGGFYDGERVSSGYSITYDIEHTFNWDGSVSGGTIEIHFYLGNAGNSELSLGKFDSGQSANVTIKKDGKVIHSQSSRDAEFDNHDDWWVYIIDSGEISYNTIPEWAS